MSYTYLASPHAHNDPDVRHSRYLKAMAATAWLLKQRIWVYAPIVHNHALAIEHGMPAEFEFWREYDFIMLEAASSFTALKIDGWQQSKGMRAEAEHAVKLKKPVLFLEPFRDTFCFSGDLSPEYLGAEGEA